MRNNLTRRAKANQNTLKQAEQLLKQVNKSFPSTKNISIFPQAKPAETKKNEYFNIDKELKELDKIEGQTLDDEFAKINDGLKELEEMEKRKKEAQTKQAPTIAELKARLNALKRGGKSRKHKSRKAFRRRRLTRRRH